MTDELSNQITALLRAMIQRNSWQLIDDEAAFVQQVIAALTASATTGDKAISQAILRLYGQLLYRQLVAREERAAEELWLMGVRGAFRSGLDSNQASDIAQETVTRIVASLPKMHDPGALIFYTFRVLRTVLREQREDDAPSSLDALVEARALPEPTDATTVAAEVERQVLNQQLLELLRRKLPNEFERIVLIRVLLLDDKPRDVARSFKLPLYRANVAKYHALQLLRGDAEFMQFCQSLRPPDKPPSAA
ncbi:MAG: sigma-70 family RNA polymerase sigma factor [Herpetosiphonaceae bacterium]|nr:sigma-70 family RNA polymerase sigma factor [Herpetosiphonaceae bacterium]